jgi:hypothetical protein
MLWVAGNTGRNNKGNQNQTLMPEIFGSFLNAVRKGVTKPVQLLTILWFGSITFLHGQTFPLQTGNNLPATNSLTPVPSSGTLLIDYDFFSIPDSLDVYCENLDIFSSGFVSGAGEFVVPYGPGASSTITIIMNQDGNPISTDAWQYTPSIVPEPNALGLLLLGASALRVWSRAGKFGRSLALAPN